jgi:FkbM family methyltransferase
MARDTRLVSIHGVPMKIFEAPECISDDIVKHQDFFEFEIFNRWKDFFDTSGYILDIGANIGNHVLQFKYHFPHSKILAFEIHDENYGLLKYNTSKLPNVKCFNVGLGSRTSIVSYNDGHVFNCGVVRVDANGGKHNIVMKLDDLFINDRISFIKMDIEGHELSALEGMINHLMANKPKIWIEDLTPNKLAINFLESHGYRVIDRALDKNANEYYDYLLSI